MTTLAGLMEKDVIEKEDEKYQIINPVVKFYALKNYKSGLCRWKKLQID